MDNRKLFKDKESDKISNEILGEIYPVEPLQKYFKFGYASALSQMEDMANTYINGKYSDKLDAHDLKRLVFEIVHQDNDLKDMFYRLRKDGVKIKEDEI